MADRRYIEIEVEAGKALRNLGKIADSAEKTAKNTDKMSKSLNRAATAIKGFVAFKITQAVARIPIAFADLADSAKNMEARLAGTTDTAEEATQAYNDLFKVAVTNGVAINGLVAGYTKLAVAVPTAEHEELVKVMGTTATVLSTTGASTQQVNAVMLQLSQALGSGALQGDEFRSVFENAPVLLRAWQEAAGLTGQSLRDLSSSAQLTTESFVQNIDAIREISIEMTGMEEPPLTASRGLENLTSGLTTLVGAIEKRVGIIEGFAETMSQIGESANEAGQALNASSLVDSIDTMTDLHEQIEVLNIEIMALEDATRDLTNAEDESLRTLRAQRDELRDRDPYARLVDARQTLITLEEKYAKVGKATTVIGRAQRKVMEGLIDAQKELVLNREEELGQLPQTKKSLEEVTEEIKNQEEALEQIQKEADKYGDTFEKALEGVNKVQSAYQEDQSTQGGAGALDNARITDQITEARRALDRGDLKLAESIRKDALKGLEQFAENADDYLSNLNFENLQKSLEAVTLDVYTQMPSDVEQAMSSGVSKGIQNGYASGKAVIENDTVRMTIVPDIQLPLEAAVLEGGARQ